MGNELCWLCLGVWDLRLLRHGLCKTSRGTKRLIIDQWTSTIIVWNMPNITTRPIIIKFLYCIRLNFWTKGLMSIGNQRCCIQLAKFHLLLDDYDPEKQNSQRNVFMTSKTYWHWHLLWCTLISFQFNCRIHNGSKCVERRGRTHISELISLKFKYHSAKHFFLHL